MGLMNKVLNRFGYSKRRPFVVPSFLRSYQAAELNRLTEGWRYSNITADGELRVALKILRGRGRELAINNDYIKRFFTLLKTNVIGDKGINLQNKAKDGNGEFDKEANHIIEAGWKDWSKKGECTVCGELSLIDVDKLLLESVARDGEALVFMVEGFSNKYRFALQLIEADHLDENYNQNLANGNQIRMGIEFDKWNKPVAYHILTNHPGGDMYSTLTNKYRRIPADKVIHLYSKNRITQSRGVPWMHTAMNGCRHLGAYNEAAVIGARIGASKMGFFLTETGEDYEGDDVDAQGNIISDVDPGMLEQLPSSVKDFKTFDPGQPSGEFGDFNKAMLRGIASGLDVSYNSLANDLEKVNFSSIRQGVLDERSAYRMTQRWLIEHLKEPVYYNWLDMALLSGELKSSKGNPLSYKYEKFAKPQFRPRGWSWVDPLKDQRANSEGVKNYQKNYSDVLAEQGIDFEDFMDQRKREITMFDDLKKFAGEKGITLTIPLFEEINNGANA